jgi:hypothetical protein
MVQVPKEEIKAGMPSDLIILRDKNGRQRILVPKCQRIALTATEHETMLHVKGLAYYTNYLDFTSGPRWQKRSRHYAMPALYANEHRYSGKTCLQLSDKPTIKTCHSNGKSMV